LSRLGFNSRIDERSANRSGVEFFTLESKPDSSRVLPLLRLGLPRDRSMRLIALHAESVKSPFGTKTGDTAGNEQFDHLHSSQLEFLTQLANQSSPIERLARANLNYLVSRARNDSCSFNSSYARMESRYAALATQPRSIPPRWIDLSSAVRFFFFFLRRSCSTA